MRFATASLAALAVVVAACGTPGGLPESPPCPTPDPALVPGSAVGVSEFATAVDRALAQFQQIDQEFRGEWPGRRFRDRDSFKRDFVQFAGASRCLVDDLRAAGVPPEMEQVTAELLVFLSQVESSLAEAEEAVATRNASAYDDWVGSFDRLVLGYTEFQDRVRPFR